ncbi:hypothetical protein PQ456_10235 [Paenibacillus kyungheensis]|uniref:Uncharacterized protein n=1 Tax=Paenibacillus kyungheensis TaxID=1452732 RepID=A0AAX3M6V2_9BACL|nr:hypothetical protein [Paenibacillus kyungheensis]WCT57867.1 hypothetical protein PQ456_10235 [Paenibacillus kyungheensis]
MNSSQSPEHERDVAYASLQKRLSECSEQDALQLMRSFDRQITFWNQEKSKKEEFRSFWKTPYPYVGIGVGIVVPVTGFVLLMLLP